MRVEVPRTQTTALFHSRRNLLPQVTKYSSISMESKALPVSTSVMVTKNVQSENQFFFAVNFPFKLFRTIFVNSDTGSLKSFHTLFNTYLDYMQAKFKPNRIVRNIHNFKLF